jgi:hypothetical protein
MIDQQEMRVAVQSVIKAAMQDTLRNILVEKPFNRLLMPSMKSDTSTATESTANFSRLSRLSMMG